MSPRHAGIHLSVVSLGSAHRVCAIWRVSGPAGPRHPCDFPVALLLPRAGAEQDWAVETTLEGLEGHGSGDGPACVDLATSADGIRFLALRPGLCAPDLLDLSHAALGQGHREWARLAADAPGAFRPRALEAYAPRWYATSVLTGSGGAHRTRVNLLHSLPHQALYAYAAGLLANAAP
ncbi:MULTISPECIES: hypothetical protein [Streptomyces]|uniref:Uncharacterized protein n=1 Tax=Streptomyces ramulosus TaxID=47762 RepID=A0ABW1FRK3_9ACTN